MTLIQLETGYIELPDSVDFPIDLSFAEITKLGARSGGFSRMLDVEGTANNMTLLGGYFDVDLENDTFDRTKKTAASVIQNGVSLFDGFIQLIAVKRVNKTQTSNAKAIMYSVFVFDEVSNFFNEMGDKELTDLKFPELTHLFTRDSIMSSWGNTSGYTYPQYSRNDFVYTLRDFKPAIYEMEYFKKIFESNGYSYEFAQFDDKDVQLNRRIIPYNGKDKDERITALVQQAYTVRGQMDDTTFTLNDTNTPDFPIGYVPVLNALNANGYAAYAAQAGTKITLDSVFQDTQGQWDVVDNRIINKAGANKTWTVQSQYDYVLKMRAEGGVPFAVAEASGGRMDIVVTLVAQSVTDSNKIVVLDGGTTAISYDNNETYPSGLSTIANQSNSSVGQFGLFDANEEFHIHALVLARYFNNSGLPYNPPALINYPNYDIIGLSLPFKIYNLDPSPTFVRVEFDIEITNLELRAVPNVEALMSGTYVDPTAFIPKKIKQRDLISSIAKSYNLIFSPDPDNSRNIIIKTRNKYYEDGGIWDWTDKFAEDQPNEITFLSNNVARRQSYQYKDDKDILNTAYQDTFREPYGTATVELENEYTKGLDTRELIYSPTVDGAASVGFALPTIDGVNPDNNIRVLLHSGPDLVPPYAFYDDILPTPSAMELVDVYNRTSMFDSVKKPNFSICFDYPKALYHNWQNGQTSNYLFNLHHAREASTLNRGRMLVGYFRLTEKDFQALSKSLDWRIYIRDNGYFNISKIVGYNASKRTLTKVELISADDELKLKQVVPANPPVSSPTGNGSALQIFHVQANFNTNIILGSGVVMGSRNFVTGNNVRVMGDNNVVHSDNAMILGDNNTAELGTINVIVMGHNTVATEQGIYIGGKLEI